MYMSAVTALYMATDCYGRQPTEEEIREAELRDMSTPGKIMPLDKNTQEKVDECIKRFKQTVDKYATIC